MFYRSKKFSKREEIIHDMCKVLIEKQYITRQFEQDVLARENMMSTEVGKGIAIPHGNIENVKEYCIALTVLKHPIRWDTEYVELVFMLCVSEKDKGKMKNIIRELYEKMDDSYFLEELESNKQIGINILNKLVY